MPCLDPSTIVAFRYLSQGRYSDARKCALDAVTKDTSKKNASIVDDLARDLERNRIDLLLERCRGAARVEHTEETFDEGLYVATEQSEQLTGRIRTLLRARDELTARNIPYRASVLLYGPTGTGKTEYARYLAHSLRLPLVTVSFARLIDSYLGKTGQNLANVFDAVGGEDCVLFLDEFDAIAVRRGKGDSSSASKELENTTIILMQLLDALPTGTLVIAATNREQDIDPAVLRRFRVLERMRPLTAPEAREIVSKLSARAEVPFDEADLDAYLAGRGALTAAAVSSDAVEALAAALIGGSDAHIKAPEGDGLRVVSRGGR